MKKLKLNQMEILLGGQTQSAADANDISEGTLTRGCVMAMANMTLALVGIGLLGVGTAGIGAVTVAALGGLSGAIGMKDCHGQF